MLLMDKLTQMCIFEIDKKDLKKYYSKTLNLNLNIIKISNDRRIFNFFC